MAEAAIQFFLTKVLHGISMLTHSHTFWVQYLTRGEARDQTTDLLNSGQLTVPSKLQLPLKMPEFILNVEI